MVQYGPVRAIFSVYGSVFTTEIATIAPSGIFYSSFIRNSRLISKTESGYYADKYRYSTKLVYEKLLRNPNIRLIVCDHCTVNPIKSQHCGFWDSSLGPNLAAFGEICNFGVAANKGSETAGSREAGSVVCV